METSKKENGLWVPSETNALNGGTQKQYKFRNGYGASVVRHSFSYGQEDGKWELAVTNGENDDLCYDTPITTDVIGHLSETEAESILDQINQLPKP